MSIMNAYRKTPPTGRRDATEAADAALRDAITAATTIAELKAALLGSKTGATRRVAGRPVQR